MKYKFLVITVLLLTGCLAGNQSEEFSEDCFNTLTVEAGELVPHYCPEKEWRVFTRENYKLLIPGGLFKFENSTGEFVFDSQIESGERSDTDYDITVWNNLDVCSAAVTGSSEITNTNNLEISIQWGKVDEGMKTWDRPYPNALCTPPPTPNCSKEDYWSSNCGGNTAAYALCSQKDDKTVLICISQMTDNPTLAEEIFSTFRWLDE